MSDMLRLGAVVLMMLSVATAHAAPAAAEANTGLAEMQAELQRYGDAATRYRKAIDTIVRREYEARRRQTVGRYATEITDAESRERSRRLAAITLFEDFLRRYPKEKRWTPDVIFRLAELYFEKSNDEYLSAQDQYEKDLGRYERKELAQPPVPPKQDYRQTVALHQRLIREWPNYRLIDGAYYLLGFCLFEMGEIEQGNQAMLALVCHNHYQAPLGTDGGQPKESAAAPQPAPSASRRSSRLTPTPKPSFSVDASVYDGCKPLYPNGRFNAEAWTRIGEYHFDENQLGAAIASYRKVLEIGPKDNAYYDEALYKLAWTYYRADKFADAIKDFDRLVVYADKEYERTGKAGSEMRPEAIQYLAVSFAEEDWDGDQQPDKQTGLERINAFYRGRENEKHVYEVYRRLADIYFDTAKYDDAVAVYKIVLKRWPYNPNNPDVQDRVVTALERGREYDRAIAEREEFTRLFGAGTEWERRNRGNPEALKKARDYDEQALIQAAVHHHKLGQERRKRGLALQDVALLNQAGEEYGLAAKAYEKYLERFPNSKNSYEIRFSYASCLFYSQRFPEAAAQYAEVRDSNLDNRYQEDAAFAATKADEQNIQSLLQAKKLTEPPLPTANQTAINTQPIPEPYKQWQASLDAYVKIFPKDAKAPRLAYKAAEIDFRFGQFPAARERFAAVYKTYCSDAVAVSSGQAILVTYQIEKNLDEMQEWATKLSGGKCGGQEAAGQVQAGAKLLLVGIRFKRAEALFKKAEQLHSAGKVQEAAPYYDKAAAGYLALVESNPESEDADKALYNAGVAYEKSMRYESATRIYERVWQKYPKSPLAGEALWRSAENYKRFFEFNRAVANYLIMADAPRFAEDPHRTDAIYNAAVILENDQDYRRSAALFLRYAEQVGKPQEAAEAYFRAGTIYEKMKDYGQTVKVFRQFPQRFGSAPGGPAHAVEAMYRIARMSAKRGDTKTASKYYKATISEYRTRGLQPASDAAEFAAAADTELLEQKLQDFQKTSLKTASLNGLINRKKALEKRAIALRAEYDKVLEYKRARYTLRALLSRGLIFEHVARAVAEGFRGLPVPPRVKRLGQDAVDIYMQQLDEALEREVRPLEDETKKLYTVCVERAQQLGVSNAYTEEARRRLNALDPGNFPLLKAPMVETVID